MKKFDSWRPSCHSPRLLDPASACGRSRRSGRYSCAPVCSTTSKQCSGGLLYLTYHAAVHLKAVESTQSGACSHGYASTTLAHCIYGEDDAAGPDKQIQWVKATWRWPLLPYRPIPTAEATSALHTEKQPPWLMGTRGPRGAMQRGYAEPAPKPKLQGR